MRLLNAQTIELTLFIGNQIPDYVILSHTWGEEELTSEDITKRPITTVVAHDTPKPGFAKLLGACMFLQQHSYRRFLRHWPLKMVVLRSPHSCNPFLPVSFLAAYYRKFC
jgi:hypothetical protein